MINEARNVVFVFGLYVFIVCARAPQFSVKSRSERNPAIIHEHVGSFIEPEEREYYGLFHGIEGFQEAVFFKRDDRGFDILIMSDEHTYYAKYDGFKADEILYDYIENHNQMQISRDDFEAKWSIVGYDILGFPITKNDVDRTFSVYRITSYTCGGILIGSCAGTLYGCHDIEYDWDVPKLSGDEDVIFWCIAGGLLTGGVVYIAETFFAKRNPVPHINKQRGPWIVE